MQKTLHIFCFGLILAIISSCGAYTKHLPEGKKLLVKQEIVIDGPEKPSSKAESILKQKANTSLFGIFRLGLFTYSLGNGTPDNFWSKLGQAPVLLDSSKSQLSAIQLHNYYFNKGYFLASSGFTTYDKRKENKKAGVIYTVSLGSQYMLRDLRHQIDNGKLDSLYRKHQSNSQIKVGGPYDASLIEAERNRLTDLFQNQGFYTFNKTYIRFTADTAVGDHQVDLVLIIDNPKQRDSTGSKQHEQFRMNEIRIRPDFKYLNLKNPTDSLVHLDYLFEYRYLDFKPRYITDAIHFKKGDKFKIDNIKATYSHMIGYQSFQSTEINFSYGGRDSIGPLLNADIKLLPADKRSFTIESEATNTSGQFGINGSLGWSNRNFFGGGEVLELKLNGGLDYQPISGDNNLSRSVEFGGEASILFPRFILLWNSEGILPKRMRPTSKIALYASNLTRFEFDRQTFGVRLSYNWRESSRKSHQIDLFDFSYSNVFNIQDDFLDGLTDLQRLTFQSEVIGATRYIYTFNGQKPNKKYYSFFRGTFELAGNLIAAVKSFGDENLNQDLPIDQLLGVPYYQYIRPEVDYRFYTDYSNDRLWVNRAYVGYILPYGNSVADDGNGKDIRYPPFTKYFFTGGANDIRAWSAYRLGPGQSFNTDYEEGTDTVFALGTFKILINSEYRFPIYGYLKGAVFVDMGNVWMTGGLEDGIKNSGFELSNLIADMAIGSGFGLRLDLNYFALRFDIGIKVRDPHLVEQGEEWVIFGYDRFDNFSDNFGNFMNNNTYNIAIGYPF